MIVSLKKIWWVLLSIKMNLSHWFSLFFFIWAEKWKFLTSFVLNSLGFPHFIFWQIVSTVISPSWQFFSCILYSTHSKQDILQWPKLSTNLKLFLSISFIYDSKIADGSSIWCVHKTEFQDLLDALQLFWVSKNILSPSLWVCNLSTSHSSGIWLV